MKADRRRWAPWLLLAPSLAWLALSSPTRAPGFQLAFQDGRAPGAGRGPRHLADPRFTEALLATLGLLALIIPVQFALAMGMALVVNALRRGRDWWLYVYALPLAVSELGAGLVWFSIFTEAGWLNSVLDAFGLGPVTWLSYERPVLLIAAIVLAEACRPRQALSRWYVLLDPNVAAATRSSCAVACRGLARFPAGPHRERPSSEHQGHTGHDGLVSLRPTAVRLDRRRRRWAGGAAMSGCTWPRPCSPCGWSCPCT